MPNMIVSTPYVLTLLDVACYRFIVPILQMMKTAHTIILSLSRPHSKAKIHDNSLHSPFHYPILYFFFLNTPDIRVNIVNRVLISQQELDH